jgi:HSP20 family protein
MSLIRWDPFRDLEMLQENVNRLFQDTMSTGKGRKEPVSVRSWTPNVDVKSDDDQIVVNVELPGMKKADIDIDLTGDTLTVRGERKFEDEANKDKYVRIESVYGAFQRSFTLGVPVKADQIKASYKEGILEITIPKADEIKPKKVEVTVE